MEGAEDGGLKMMWSCSGESSVGRNDASGLTRSFFFVRRKEDSWRAKMMTGLDCDRQH